MDGLLRRLIAIVQIAGGLLGVGMVLYGATHGGGLAPPVVLFLGLYFLSLIAGIGLWRKSAWAMALSILVQAAQILWIARPRFTYQFVSGLAGWVVFGQGAGVRTSGQLGSQFEWSVVEGFGLPVATEPSHVGVNVVALVIACWLAARLVRKLRQTGTAPTIS
jgi:hypothetical protein